MIYDDIDDEAPDEDDLDDIADDDVSETLPCPACGRPVYEDAVQCPLCGNYIHHASAVLARPPDLVDRAGSAGDRGGALVVIRHLTPARALLPSLRRRNHRATAIATPEQLRRPPHDSMPACQQLSATTCRVGGLAWI